MRCLIEQAARPRNRHMIRRRFIPPIFQKPPQAQAIGYSPGNAAFAADALKKSDQQSTEIHSRSQRGTSQLGVVKLRAFAFAEGVELRLLQHSAQLLIERMTRRFSLLASVKHLLLSFPPSLLPHRHELILC